VGISLPTIEVRFQNLKIEADCYVGDRALPSLPNAARNLFESLLSSVGINLTKKTKLNILKDVSGMVKPSRMTLLLGPPSSGKTTLLLALAGKLDSSLKAEGEITYNGHKLNEFEPRKTSAYISQYDVHVGEMTVKETFDFAARCQGVGSKIELLAELARREKQAGIFPEADVDLFMKGTAIEGYESSLVTYYIIRILGLDMCRDTYVGDAMRKGISGGQKKRVTTGEMLVGPAKTLFMDEISTGLDSSTTFQIVRCLQQIVHYTESTILMSLLQPAPETFDLFDDIILLSEGHIVYQGPRENVLEFFESCGFRLPERKGTPDFLQEVTSRKDQEQYWADRSKPYRYIPVSEFVERFKSFHVGENLNNELSVPYDKNQSHKAALVFKKYLVPKRELLKASWDKEWLLIKRNSPIYIFKTVQFIILSSTIMTVFFRSRMHTRNEQDGLTYIGTLAFSLLLNMFNGLAEIALTIIRLPVIFKQRDLLFHPPWAYTLPTFLLRVPISLLESSLWMAIEIPGVPKMPEKYNPATWMLEVSSTVVESRLQIDFAEHFKSSTLHQRNKDLVRDLSTPPLGAEDLHFVTQYSQSTWGQFKSCIWKMWWSYWRNPDYNLVRNIFTLAASLMIGITFWKIGEKRESSNNLTTIVGALYAGVFFVGMNNCQTAQPVVASERTVFYRERAAGMYSTFPYAMAQVLVEIPYVFVETICFTFIVYPMVSFDWTAPKVLWFFFISFCSFLYFTYYGLMTVSITPNEQTAAVLAVLFYGLFNFFSGFFIPRPRIPKWWVWYYWICPIAWSVYGYIVSQYHDAENTIKVPGMSYDPAMNSYIKDYYGFRLDFMGPIATVLVTFCVIFALIYALCLRILNFQVR
ncbi:hypothetical protein M8C21_029251, partial [Ambrosia artemisiifolia]